MKDLLCDIDRPMLICGYTMESHRVASSRLRMSLIVGLH